MNEKTDPDELFRARVRTVDGVAAAGSAIERLAIGHGLQTLEATRFRFLVEELCGERLEHAFAPGEQAEARIILEQRPGEFVVTITDAGPKPGGMMRYGIPSYRLPREIIDAEIDRILAMGVRLESGVTVTDLGATMADGGFDAAFLAVGAQVGKRAYIPAGDSAKILDAVSYLHEAAGYRPPLLGRRVAVYGGGDTAMDAARTAVRLGATDAVIVYRRTRGQMPAHAIEVDEATVEGVRMMWLSTIARADAEKITVEKMELDESGFPQPTGEFTELDADAVVLALGQESDLSLVDGLAAVGVADGSGVAVGVGVGCTVAPPHEMATMRVVRMSRFFMPSSSGAGTASRESPWSRARRILPRTHAGHRR